MLKLVRNLFGSFWLGLRPVQSLEAKQTRPPNRGMFVRLATGKRVEIAGAVYQMSAKGGRILFLDENQQILAEFPWNDVVAYGEIS